MHSFVMSSFIFDRATFAFRRKHVSFTHFAFVTITWLSIVLSSQKVRKFVYTTLEARKSNQEKAGSIEGAGHFFNPCTDCYRSKTAVMRKFAVAQSFLYYLEKFLRKTNISLFSVDGQEFKWSTLYFADSWYTCTCPTLIFI